MNERLFNIAAAANRFVKRWGNTRRTWEELKECLLNVRETSETAAEYRAMGRERQTDVKDVGGFVGGYLRDGLRKSTHVEYRSLICLDYDDFSEARMADLRAAMAAYGCAWVAHSTHKHTADAWRIRVVIPAGRDMVPDEYMAVARRVAEKIGFDGIDRSTFEAARLMFWGSRSKGAPYVAESDEGGWLDVDAVLGSYDEWRDMSAWPLLPGEVASGFFADDRGGERRISAAGLLPDGRARQEDPTQRRGVVGAWCRCHDVHDVIATHLSGVYVRHSAGRYTHVGSKTVGGAWVVEGGKFLYSFHATDPASGRLLNSWDLCELHLFGDLRDPRKRGERSPAYQAMERMALADPAVKSRMMSERAAEFDGFDLGGGESGAPCGATSTARGRAALQKTQAQILDSGEADRAEAADSAEAADPMEEEMALWEERRGHVLKTQKDGSVRSSISNCIAILNGDPRLRDRVALDDFTGFVMVEGPLPWRRTSPRWNNTDDALLRVFLDREYGINGANKVDDALMAVANRRGYHPVRRYFESLEWDGVKRLGGLFTDVIGAEKTDLNRELAHLIFVGAVARIFEPGCKFDYFIIVSGPEGCGKSTLFSVMGGPWFSDSVATIEGKEGMESVQGKLIIELGELVGVKRSAVESLKSFISRQEDRYRPAYGRKEEWRPRQCVLVGTTNEDLFLSGITTGNRRSPVVDVNPELRTIKEEVGEYVTRWRDQLWAEAVALYRGGYKLWLNDELTAEARKTQDTHNLDKQNALFPEVARFLDLPLPQTWDTGFSQSERFEWLDKYAMNPGAMEAEETTFGAFRPREYVTVAEILQELFRIDRASREYTPKGREIGQYMNSLTDSWKFCGTRKNRIYGKQKTWHRVATETDFVATDSVASSVADLDDL